jgi:carotenoid cleavage dioxygenase-like enzyme
MPILSPTLPRSYVTSNRAELDRVPLTVKEGELPQNISGHYFVIGPAGTVDSGGLPWPEGQSTTVLCGDGMVVRFDFDQPGEAFFSSRLMKTPDYWADHATATQPGF